MSDCWVRTRFRAAAFVGLFAMAAGASPATAETVIKKCTGVLTDNSLQPRAELGWAVDVDGDWLVGGARGAGTVALYKNPKAEDPPQQPQQKIPSPGRTGDRFGYSVSLSGGWLAVGAPSGDGGIRESGVVYLFNLQQNADGTFNWEQKAKLEARDAVRDDQFGFAVALRGDTLVVGAPYDSDRGTRAGSIYVFQSSGGTWAQTVKLHAADSRPFDLFGSAVAVDAETLVAGAPFADDLNVLRNFGAVYVFKRDGIAWNQTNKLTAGEFRPENIQFGAAVAIHENRIAVGAPGDDLAGLDSGSAVVFEKNGASWDRLDLMLEDPGKGKQFGTAVDLDAAHVAVGAPFDSHSKAKAGAAYLFDLNAQRPAVKLILDTEEAPGSTFGRSVALHDTTVYPGGPLYLNAGAIAVCPKEEEPPKKPVLECKKTGPASVDAGKTATYTISVSNTGPVPATGVTLTDATPAGLALVSLSCPGLLGPPDHRCDLGTLNKGDAAKQVTVTFRVPAGYNGPPSFKNIAEVSATEIDSSLQCPASSPTFVRKPDLVCTKSPPEEEDGKITYTVTVRNEGLAEVRDVRLDDRAPAGLVFDAVGPPCAKLPCKLGTLQPGDPPVGVEVTFRRAAGCRPPVDNVAHVSGSGGQEHECRSPVPEKADLAVKVEDDEVPEGQEIEIPVSISNAGPDQATSVEVQVDIQGADSVTAVPSGCTADPDIPGRFHCTLAEICAKFLTFRVKAPACSDCAAPPEPIQVKAEVRSDTPDPDPSNNSDHGEIRVTCSDIVCLAIDKTDSPDPVAPGHPVIYDITVKNVGDLDAPGVTVKDLAPEALTKIRWCRGANCQPTKPGPLVTQLDLPAQSSEVFRLRGIASECGTLVNKAIAEHPPGTTAEALEDTQVEGISLLCNGIDGLLVEGSLITYTFLLINCGPNIQGDNPGDEFTDTLPPGLTLVGVSADSGTPGMSGNTATWNGSIGVGDTVTIQVQATIDLGTLGMLLCNQAELSADLDGDGINEASILSDDPVEPGDQDPCCIVVTDSPAIPTLSEEAALILVLLLTALTLRRLRDAR